MGKPILLLISGSVRDGSVNSAVVSTVAGIAATSFTPVVFGGLGSLPHFNPDRDRDPLPPEVAALRQAIDAASALLVSTPEYAGAMPGALKNLLEWTVGGVETTGKPTGWINPSTNPGRAARTYESLRTVLEYTDAAVVPGACLDVPVPRSMIGSDGLIHDAAARASMADAVAALEDAIG